MQAERKPLGRKAYGSIGHIQGSRLGPGDHTVHEGQGDLCISKPHRNWRIVVQTKLDGSCVSAAKLEDGSIVALGRAGYLASTSNYEMHRVWDRWVKERLSDFDKLLSPGERVVGEWLAQAHGTIYNLEDREPFVAFDIMEGSQRIIHEEFQERTKDLFAVPDYLYGPIDPLIAIDSLDVYGAEDPEGVVYRAEEYTKNGPKVQFLAKYVLDGKEDGKYLKADPPIWNWQFEN